MSLSLWEGGGGIESTAPLQPLDVGTETDRAGRYARPMSTSRHTSALEDITRDLDMLVYRLERDRAASPNGPDPARLRRELEQLRDRLTDVVRQMDG